MQGSLKDLLDLTDLSLAFLLVLDLLVVVALDQIDKLIDVAAWNDNVASPLFLLQLASHLELLDLRSRDDSTTNGSFLAIFEKILLHWGSHFSTMQKELTV